MINQLINYFSLHFTEYWGYVLQHLLITVQAVLIASLIGVSLGYLSYKVKYIKQAILLLVQGLRVIPSLGILFILIPLLGVGFLPALLALVILATTPVLLNTVVGFEQVPAIYIETGLGMGMSDKQLFWNVLFPLALPKILTGIKLSLVEVIASATLATYIGAGGLGTLIFSGLSLYRYDLIVIGAGSVTILALISMILFDWLIRFQTIKGGQ